MSTNFTGVTFAMQKVTPTDDAIVRRAIFPDGILSGCELSYSGSTLTMAAGQLMICGRQIRHPAPQNWAVVDATTGFARLLLTIDLSRTSTKEVFDQVVDTIEYASSVDGFPDLEQADINGVGTRYQVVVCVVSLGTGGITGVVSQLAQSVVAVPTGLEMTILWENASPTSAFVTQVVEIDYTEYELLLVAVDGGSQIIAPKIGASARYSHFNIWGTGTASAEAYYRATVVEKTGIRFGVGYFAATNTMSFTADNNKLIPLAIYGIKGVTA